MEEEQKQVYKGLMEELLTHPNYDPLSAEVPTGIKEVITKLSQIENGNGRLRATPVGRLMQLGGSLYAKARSRGEEMPELYIRGVLSTCQLAQEENPQGEEAQEVGTLYELALNEWIELNKPEEHQEQSTMW